MSGCQSKVVKLVQSHGGSLRSLWKLERCKWAMEWQDEADRKGLGMYALANTSEAPADEKASLGSPVAAQTQTALESTQRTTQYQST